MNCFLRILIIGGEEYSSFSEVELNYTHFVWDASPFLQEKILWGINSNKILHPHMTWPRDFFIQSYVTRADWGKILNIKNWEILEPLNQLLNLTPLQWSWRSWSLKAVSGGVIPTGMLGEEVFIQEGKSGERQRRGPEHWGRPVIRRWERQKGWSGTKDDSSLRKGLNHRR